MTKRVLSSLMLLLLLLGQLSAESGNPRILINSGHNQSVTYLKYDKNHDLIFSGSDDGSIKIWNTGNGDLIFSENISINPIQLVTLHPEKPEAAVVTSDTLNSFVLLVYNWETGEQLYNIKLDELPLFLQYSPKGSYIVYGITNWKSLAFIESSSGSVLPYLTEGFGIVSSAFISGSEKTILTYSPSGYIQYWSVEEGTLKKRVPTLPNLDNIVFTDSGRYMAGSNSRGMVFVDLLTGTPINEQPLETVDYVSLNPDNQDLAVYSRSNGGWILSIFDLSSNRLFLKKHYTNLDIRKVNAITSKDGNIFMAESTGEIRRFNIMTETLSSFSQSDLYSISDAAVNSEGILLASDENIIAIDPVFFDSFTSLSPVYQPITTYPLPFQGSPGIERIDNEKFILWTREAPGGTLALFSPSEGVIKLYDDYPYSFTDVTYRDNKIISLDKNGECRILNLGTDEIEFRLTSFGIRTICLTEEGNIIGGRSQSSGVLTPLLHINTSTGETVDIDDTNLLISDLNYDSATGNIYSLGIEERRGRLRTVLKRHSDSGFVNAETILTALGENLDASMLIEEDGTRIFTSLATGGVNMLYWGGFSPFETTGYTSGKLILLGNYLIGLNTNGSLTFWNKASGEEEFIFYLFADLNWVALFPDNSFSASPGGIRYVRVFDGKSRLRLPPADYLANRE